jgi:enamine deaminase RidA (YjgF/YER057c/UK114 family)
VEIEHLNPETLIRSPAFSQAVKVTGAGSLVFVGGQNGVSADGVMADGLGAQTEQALRNVLAALAAAGAVQQDVVKLTINLVQGGDIREGFAASQRVWGPHATAITVLVVAGLANPQALVEVEAIAALAG